MPSALAWRTWRILFNIHTTKHSTHHTIFPYLVLSTHGKTFREVVLVHISWNGYARREGRMKERKRKTSPFPNTAYPNREHLSEWRIFLRLDVTTQARTHTYLYRVQSFYGCVWAIVCVLRAAKNILKWPGISKHHSSAHWQWFLIVLFMARIIAIAMSIGNSFSSW